VRSIKKREVKTLENQEQSKDSLKNFPLSTSSFGAFFNQRSHTPTKSRGSGRDGSHGLLKYIKIDEGNQDKKLTK
jgi:hypothetical protein